MSLPTSTVPVPPWLRVTSYLAFWTRLSYAAGTYYDSPDCDPNLSQRSAADCLALVPVTLLYVNGTGTSLEH